MSHHLLHAPRFTLPPCFPSCVRACVHVCLCACVRACMPACVRACVSVCLPPSLPPSRPPSADQSVHLRGARREGVAEEPVSLLPAWLAAGWGDEGACCCHLSRKQTTCLSICCCCCVAISFLHWRVASPPPPLVGHGGPRCRRDARLSEFFRLESTSQRFAAAARSPVFTHTASRHELKCADVSSNLDGVSFPSLALVGCTAASLLLLPRDKQWGQGAANREALQPMAITGWLDHWCSGRQRGYPAA